jgi:L-asparaginase
MRKATQSLLEIAQLALKEAHTDPMQTLVSCLKGLENDSTFNAGYGAALQADGKPRLTAALMAGPSQTFSGVMGVTDIRHPSLLALALQGASARVLTPPGAEQLARKLHLPVENLVTQKRLEYWQKQIHQAFFDSDTVGTLYCQTKDQLLAGTSTGGRGFEEPGRISDSATVAGTYATPFAAISATGVGEEIVDDAVAARIETRVRDGMSLKQACWKTHEEAKDHKRSYGWIACDHTGAWCAAFTTQAMSYLVIDVAGEVLASS